MTNKSPAQLLSLATAVPPFVFETTAIAKQAAETFKGLGVALSRLLPIYANSGIDQRYSVCPMEWFLQPRGWPDRTAKFMEGATSLFKQAASQALADAHLKASEIDAIVTVSSTGISTPSIEAHVMVEMGFRVNVQRVPVFGLGCAGGISGLSLAARLAAAEPGKKVLIVIIELCTLAFRLDEMTKANIVATAIFGDGAAAAILCASDNEGLGAIEYAGEHTWPGTIDVMGWRVDPEGFGAIFSRDIPDLASNDLRPAADLFLERYGLTIGDINHFSFHPGGAKVIAALEPAFGIDTGRLVNERKILREFGKTTIERGLFDEELVPEELTQVRMGKIIKDKFPQLDAEDQEAVRQHAVAALNLTQKAKEVAAGSSLGEERVNTAFVDGVRKFAMDVRELDIDLIDRVNPFGEAYAILAKTMSEDSLKQVAAAIAAKRTSLTPEEAKVIAKRAVEFKRERGRLPSISSADAWEKHLAEGAAAFVRFKDEGRYE